MKCACCGICTALCLCGAVFLGGEALQELDCREWLDGIAIEIFDMDCVVSDVSATEPDVSGEDEEKSNFREADDEPTF